jgi:hypothetical protein
MGEAQEDAAQESSPIAEVLLISNRSLDALGGDEPDEEPSEELGGLSPIVNAGGSRRRTEEGGTRTIADHRRGLQRKQSQAASQEGAGRVISLLPDPLSFCVCVNYSSQKNSLTNFHSFGGPLFQRKVMRLLNQDFGLSRDNKPFPRSKGEASDNFIMSHFGQ